MIDFWLLDAGGSASGTDRRDGVLGGSAWVTSVAEGSRDAKFLDDVDSFNGLATWTCPLDPVANGGGLADGVGVAPPRDRLRFNSRPVG